MIDTIKMNVSKLIKYSGQPSQAKFAAYCGVSQSAVNKVFNSTNELPSMKTIVAIAEKNRVPVWAMLMRNFPWELAKGKRLDTISNEGYQMLHAFENSSPETKKAILTQTAFLLQSTENKPKDALLLMEAREKYIARE